MYAIRSYYAGLRNAAVDMLVRMGSEAVPSLLTHADSTDHDVRKFIVDILGEIGDRRAIPVLLSALADADGNVRAAAAENLGKLQAVEAVPALLDAIVITSYRIHYTKLYEGVFWRPRRFPSLPPRAPS